MLAALVAVGLGSFTANRAQAVVRNAATPAPSERPSDAVVARWSDNASGVVIAPNYILTTAHQGLLVGNYFVNIAGTAYKFDPADIRVHPTADLRVVKITTLSGQPANLNTYVDVFNEWSDGDEVGKKAVLGGYGRAAGTELYVGSLHYGYNWSTSGGNTTLRWGTNMIDDSESGFPSGGRSSEVLVDDFDPLGKYGATESEAALALYDSGGGWFVQSGGEWKVAGLSAYVEHSGQSWFRNPLQPGDIGTGDENRAIRLSSYTSFIYSQFPELYLPGDMDGNGRVDNFDISSFELALTDPDAYLRAHPALVNFHQRADINGDGILTNFDIGYMEALLTSYGVAMSSAAATSATVPEPASGALLLVGGAVLAAVYRGRLRRQRRSG